MAASWRFTKTASASSIIGQPEMPAAQKRQSPYQRHGKSPYQYSDLYRRWRTARLHGREAEARALGNEHTARYMPPLRIWDMAQPEAQGAA